MENNTTSGGRFLKVVVPIVAIVAILAAGYFYNQVRMLKEDPQALAKKDNEVLVSKVGRLFALPEGEVPTVATVSDIEALKDQPFFTGAQVGDKVLIYTTSKQAILYSVSMNKVLKVAPLNIGEGSKAPAN
jgi:hypothetical protein